MNSNYLDTCSNCSHETPTNAQSDNSEVVYEFLECESNDKFGEIAQMPSVSTMEAGQDHSYVQVQHPELCYLLEML